MASLPGEKLKQHKFTPFEHEVYRQLKGLPLANRQVVVALSGGVDSQVLAVLLYRLKKALGYDLLLAHCHHGLAADAHKEQQVYRDGVRRFVADFAQELGVDFVTNYRSPESVLQSEGQLREFRYNWLREVCAKNSILALGHHRDDWLETQLIQLVRGTAGAALYPPTLFYGNTLRPLIFVGRKEVISYAEEWSIRYRDDPSNEDQNLLRNWMRHDWLPQLEKKAPGSLQALGRSLSHLANKIRQESEEEFAYAVTAQGIDREHYLTLPETGRQRALAHFLKQKGVSEFSSGHVHELTKRLDRREKAYTFNLLGHLWSVQSDVILASPLERQE